MARKQNNTRRFSISDQPRFPHTKLTCERFPRALATRIIKEERDEYFGAFLNRTSARILIDFLNRTFRLRSCAIEIDGSFEVPCTQYYSKRCVAPCVASLCDSESYLEIVELARLFLSNDRERLKTALQEHLGRASEGLDFEKAAFFRDILKKVEDFWSRPRWHVWLADAVDTYELYLDDDAVYVIVVSQRGRRTLGEAVYAFAALDDPLRALRELIEQFYRFHLPREIRVSHDFDGREALEDALGKRFEKKVDINVAGKSGRRPTAERAIEMTKARLALERAKNRLTVDQMRAEIRQAFEIQGPLNRIEAFDVAHISATGFAAAVSVWEYGEYLPDEYEHWQSDRESELDTLRAFVANRTSRTIPELILIDGGRSHLRVATEAIGSLPSPPTVIAAVKPKGKHAAISHFLTTGSRLEFDQDNEVHQLLQTLRDEAHDLANATHRLGRDMMHFYELAAILPSLNEPERQALLREFGSIRKIVALDEKYFGKRFGSKRAELIGEDLRRFRDGRSSEPRPLIVPIRFVETGGAAEDLIPIVTR